MVKNSRLSRFCTSHQKKQRLSKTPRYLGFIIDLLRMITNLFDQKLKQKYEKLFQKRKIKKLEIL